MASIGTGRCRVRARMNELVVGLGCGLAVRERGRWHVGAGLGRHGGWLGWLLGYWLLRTRTYVLHGGGSLAWGMGWPGLAFFCFWFCSLVVVGPTGESIQPLAFGALRLVAATCLLPSFSFSFSFACLHAVLYLVFFFFLAFVYPFSLLDPVKDTKSARPLHGN